MSSAKALKFVTDHDTGSLDKQLTWDEYWDSRASSDKKCGSSFVDTGREEDRVVSVTNTTGNCVTDTAKKVWSTVTEKCSRTVNVKNCWKNWNIFSDTFWSCRWKVLTETYDCVKDKLVKIVKQVVAGFADCWKSVVAWFKNKVGGPIMDFMSKCTSVSACLDQLLAGPKWLWDKILELAKKGVNAVLNSGPLGDGIRYVGNVVKKVPPVAKEVAGVAKDI